MDPDVIISSVYVFRVPPPGLFFSPQLLAFSLSFELPSTSRGHVLPALGFSPFFGSSKKRPQSCPSDINHRRGTGLFLVFPFFFTWHLVQTFVCFVSSAKRTTCSFFRSCFSAMFFLFSWSPFFTTWDARVLGLFWCAKCFHFSLPLSCHSSSHANFELVDFFWRHLPIFFFPEVYFTYWLFGTSFRITVVLSIGPLLFEMLREFMLKCQGAARFPAPSFISFSFWPCFCLQYVRIHGPWSRLPTRPVSFLLTLKRQSTSPSTSLPCGGSSFSALVRPFMISLSLCRFSDARSPSFFPKASSFVRFL